MLIASLLRPIGSNPGCGRRALMSTLGLLQNERRPDAWKAAAPRPSKSTTTFSRQDDLPRLPIPDFNATIRKLEASLKPLAWSDDEWKACQEKIRQFSARDGLGLTLHERLLQRSKSQGVEHWLEDFWDNAAYLKYRETVMINVSYYYGFAHPPPHLPLEPVSRAACLIRAALLQRRDLRQGRMPIDMNRKDPICMDTWRWMFDCSRIPGLDGSDWSVSAAQEGDDGTSGHVIVFRHGQPWKIEISHRGRLLSVPELEKQLQYIYDHADPNSPAVGVLTSQHRDIWAKDFATLRDANPVNQGILKHILTSAFVVCLDSVRPSDPYELSRTLFHGGEHGESLGNRWLDKPGQLIVCDNGEAGYMGEHSVMDGTPSVTMLDRMLTTISSREFDAGDNGPEVLEAPQPLSWVVNPEIISAIQKAQTSADALISKQALGMFTVNYGRDEIKRLGFSPDGWTQMLIQLAYHRLCTERNGAGRRRDGGTYEAASTRGFLKGRTETIRIVTEEVMRWCDSMDDSKVDLEDRRALFKAAASKHREDADAAVKASGIDRHLFGMKNMLQPGDSTPPLFNDPLYSRGATWTLSTSAIFSSYFTRGYGWGQVVPNGFGVAYMTGFPDRLEFTVTSERSQPNERFLEYVRNAATDLRAIFGTDVRMVKANL